MNEFMTIEMIITILPEETKVPAIKGVVRWIGDRKTGTSTKGNTKGKEWSLQNVLLCDPDKEREEEFSSINLCLSGCEPFDESLKGKEIVFHCHHGQRGLSGLVVDKYNASKRLKLTRTGKISLLSSYGSGEPETANEGEQSTPQEPVQQNTVTKPAEGDSDNPPSEAVQKRIDNINMIRRQAGRLKAIHNICFDCAVSMAVDLQNRHGYTFTPSQIEAWARSYFSHIMNRGSGELQMNSNEFPFDVYRFVGYEGKKVVDLIPDLQQSVDEAREHKIRHEAATNEDIKAAAELASGENQEGSELIQEEVPEQQDSGEDDIEEEAPF